MNILKKIVIVITLLSPSSVFAATTVPWTLQNLTDSFISPNLVNGVAKGITVQGTSTLATTTAIRLGVSSTTPGSVFSIGTTNGINFSTATSTFNSTGGLNLTSGCFAISGNCIGVGMQFKTVLTIGSSNADYITNGTNDQVACNNAMAALSSVGGGTVEFKPGTYYFSARCYSSVGNITIDGLNRGAVTIVSTQDQSAAGTNGLLTFYSDGNTPIKNVTFKNITFNLNNTLTPAIVVRGNTNTATTSSNFIFDNLEIYGRKGDQTGAIGSITISGSYSGVVGSLSDITISNTYIHDNYPSGGTGTTTYSIDILSNNLDNMKFENDTFRNLYGTTIALAGGTPQGRKDWIFDGLHFYNTKIVESNNNANHFDINDATREGFTGIKITNNWWYDATNTTIYTQNFDIAVYNSLGFITSGNHFYNSRAVIAPGYTNLPGNEDIGLTFSDNQIINALSFSDPDGNYPAIYDSNIFYGIVECPVVAGYGQHNPSTYSNNTFENDCLDATTSEPWSQSVVLNEIGGNTFNDNTFYTSTTTINAPAYAFFEIYNQASATNNINGVPYNLDPNTYTNNHVEGFGITTRAFALNSSLKHVIQDNTGLPENQILNINQNLTYFTATSTLAASDIVSGNYTTVGLPTKNIIDFGGNTGIGTTSPFADLSIHANNGDTNAILFAIGSSTASATTTLFSVNNVGSTTIGLFGACSGSSALTTNSSGTIACGSISATGGSPFPFTPTTFGVSTANSTSTLIGFTQGIYSLASSTFTGTINTFLFGPAIGNTNFQIGVNALSSASLTGDNNLALGKDALSSNTSGARNLAIGSESLKSVISNGFNVAVGSESLENDTAVQNTAVGESALLTDVTGDNNTAIGVSALKNATNFGNTALGSSAGQSLTSGNSNVFMGRDAGNNTLQKVDAVGSVAVGQGSYTTASNQVVLGNLSTTQTLLRGNTGVASSSPFARFSVQANNGDTNLTLFAVASSTASATTTLFSIKNSGTVTLTSANSATDILDINSPGGNTIAINGFGYIIAPALSTSFASYFDGGQNFILNFGANTNIGSDNNKNIRIFPQGTGITSVTNNFGVGTTTPTTQLSSVAASTTAGTVQTAYNGVVAIIAGLENTTVKLFFEIDQWGHQITSGDAPSISGGTSSVSGNDNNGTITVTGTALTSVTLTFAHAWSTAPDCTESDNSTALTADITSISTTQVVFGFSIGVNSGTVWYRCTGHQ